eukprot:14405776-Heterocapsa_arctica.AAC.1
MTAKAGRLARIRGPAKLKRAPARAVLVAGGLYGSEVIGMAKGQLRKLRTAMATALGGCRRGRRCLTAYLAVNGARDPAVDLVERTVLQWARAAWRGEISDEPVGPSWRRAAGRVRGKSLAAAVVRGLCPPSCAQCSPSAWNLLRPLPGGLVTAARSTSLPRPPS